MNENIDLTKILKDFPVGIKVGKLKQCDEFMDNIKSLL